MSLQDLGAIGEVVSGIAVVLSLVYVAHQVRQSARQIEQNSRHLEASIYYATNDAFFRWFALLAQDESLVGLWNRALAGETLSHDETTRVNSLIAMLFTCYENNFQQLRFGAIRRNTLEIGRHDLSRLMSRPVIQTWWKRHGLGMLTPEFRRAIESLVSKVNSAKDAAQQDAAGPQLIADPLGGGIGSGCTRDPGGGAGRGATQPFHIALARPSGSFEFTYAEIGMGTTSVTGDMEMAFQDSWAHFCVHHFNQDGLIRERSRLTAWLGA